MERRKGIKNFDAELLQEDAVARNIALFDGYAGEKTNKLLHITKVTCTTQTIEIERYGADVVMTLLTLGAWFFYCKTNELEVYAVEDFTSITFVDGVIYCTLMQNTMGRTGCCGGKPPGVLMLDITGQGDFGTYELYCRLKNAWDLLRPEEERDNDVMEIEMLEVGASESAEADSLLGSSSHI